MSTSRPTHQMSSSRRIAMKASRSPPRRRGEMKQEPTHHRARCNYRDIAPLRDFCSAPSRDKSPEKSPGYSFQSSSRIEDLGSVFACFANTPTTAAPPTANTTTARTSAQNQSIVDTLAQNVNNAAFWNSTAALAAHSSLGLSHVSNVAGVLASHSNSNNYAHPSIASHYPKIESQPIHRLSNTATNQLYSTPPNGFSNTDRINHLFPTNSNLGVVNSISDHDAFALGPSAGTNQLAMDDDFYVRAAARAADSAKLSHRVWLKEAQQRREADAQLKGLPLSAKDKERERSRRESAVTRKRAEVYIAELERAARTIPALERRILALSAALQAAATATATAASHPSHHHHHHQAHSQGAAAAMLAFASPASASNNSPPSSTDDDRRAASL